MAQFDQKALIETPKYSRFEFPYESIGTLQMGIGTPVLHKSVVPGDDWNVVVDQIMRLAPLSSPVFDDVSLHFRSFFVPNRILDPRWKEFITGGIGLYGSSDNEIAPLLFTIRSLVSAPDERVPSVNNPAAGVANTYCAGVGGLADWLNFHFAHYDPATGRPANKIFDTGGNVTGYGAFSYATASSEAFDLLPFLGYQKIYDDWYRNERYQDERLPYILNYLTETSADDRLFDLEFTDVADNRNPFAMWRANYGKDRYTTALPEPVIGGDVYYGMSGDSTAEVTVESTNNDGGQLLGKDGRLYGVGNGYAIVTGGTYDPTAGTVVNGTQTARNVGYSRTSDTYSLVAQIAQAAQDTIRNLKTAFKMYSFFMKDTYNGNRYVEFMDSHFDVRVPDSTLDRAIYLCDHKVRISFGEVFQTSGAAPESGEGVLGDYAGRGAAYSDGGFLVNEKFLEHGQLYVIATIVPRAKYFQGIDRKFFKKDRFSYFFPEFQNIGDDILYTQELYNLGVNNDDLTTLGFAPRWADLKENLDEVHGDFLVSMDEYHFGRVFDNAPVIGSKFSQIPTINRPFSVTDDFSENYLINMRWNCIAHRPLLMYETF